MTVQRDRCVPGYRSCVWLSTGLICWAAPLAFVHKTRDINVPNQAVLRLLGNIEGRTCVLIDDMIDIGGTIAGAVKVLADRVQRKLLSQLPPGSVSGC